MRVYLSIRLYTKKGARVALGRQKPDIAVVRNFSRLVIDRRKKHLSTARGQRLVGYETTRRQVSWRVFVQ